MVNQNTKATFLPVILGTDLNAYAMATSFHEKYGVKPVLVGKLRMLFTDGSTILETIHYHKDLTNPETFKAYLKEIAEQYSQEYEHLILIGTNDIYVNLIIDHSDYLKNYYVFNYIDQELRDQLFYKKKFYQLCEKYDVDIPETHFYNCGKKEEIPTDFTFPIVVKPSDVVEYQERGLHAEHKLYKVQNQEELEAAIQTVVKAGYQGDLILQEFIPGDDHHMWDAVYYGNQSGEGQLITLAQVVLQERASHLIGAYTALVVRHDEKVMDKLVQVMEKVGYKGFANFDMKYDPRDGKLKVFEVNIRQGRSSSYISFCDEHLSEYFVDDLIYQKEKPLTYFNEEFLFTVVPKKVLTTFIKDEALHKEVQQLLQDNKYGNPMLYKPDKGIKHRINMQKRINSYYKVYEESEANSTFYKE